MLQTLTAKLKILPDEQDFQLLHDTMRAYADACSFVAQKIVSDQIPLSNKKIHKAVYKDCRSEFDLPSQMSESVIRTVVASFKSIRTKVTSFICIICTNIATSA